MGCIKNINYNSFPKQNDNLGKILEITLSDGSIEEAFIVRSDAEEPFGKILRTFDGKYLSDSEINNFKLPKQGENNRKRVEICFYYDTTKILNGTIVRDDIEEPYNTFIHLDNGKILRDFECQYHPQLTETQKVQIEKRINPYIEELSNRLKKIKSHKRPKELHGIYKQMVINKKGRVNKGKYNKLTFKDGAQITDFRMEGLVKKIVEFIDTGEFIQYVAEKMSQYPHLINHASKLKKTYNNRIHINFETPKSNPRLN